MALPETIPTDLVELMDLIRAVYSVRSDLSWA